MGWIRHHAIVLTGYDEHLEMAHKYATGLEMAVSEIGEQVINGYRSFAVFPDGSKEGWTDSDDGDGKRSDLKAFLRSMAYKDDSTPVSWAEVQYGDDGLDTKVVDDSDVGMRKRYPVQERA